MRSSPALVASWLTMGYPPRNFRSRPSYMALLVLIAMVSR